MEKKFKSIFSCSISKIANAEFDKYISLANLESLKKLMPEDIDFQRQPNLIGVAMNICVAGRRNANGHAISNATGLEVTKFFKSNPINFDRNRSRNIGYICNTGFSKFGSNDLLSLEDIAKLEEPFNIAIAGILFGTSLSEQFVKLLEETTDSSSENYGKLSASWEIFYDEYDIAVGGKNISEAKIINDPQQKAEYEQYLQDNGGKGVKNGEYVYRVIRGETIIPAGIGLVEHPAADVKGLVIIGSETEKPNNSSQTEDAIVKNNSENIMIMKIKNRAEITDENLKVATAADIDQIINDELEIAAKKIKAEKEVVETELKASKDNFSKLETEHNTLKTSFEEMQKQLNTLVAEKQEKEQTEKFNQRMVFVDDTYQLNNEERSIIANKIKGMNDESFTAYSKELEVLLKEKNKEHLKAVAEAKTKESKAAEEKQLAEAVKDGKKEEETIVIGKTVAEPSLKDKYEKAFGEDGWEINFKRR